MLYWLTLLIFTHSTFEMYLGVCKQLILADVTRSDTPLGSKSLCSSINCVQISSNSVLLYPLWRSCCAKFMRISRSICTISFKIHLFQIGTIMMRIDTESNFEPNGVSDLVKSARIKCKTPVHFK